MAHFAEPKPKPWENDSRPTAPTKSWPRPTYKSRSPRRQEMKPEKESQTIMVFDNNTGRFTTFVEDSHIQTVNTANEFLDVKKCQEQVHMDPPQVIFEDSEHPFDDQQYQQYHYEHTGLEFQGKQNYFILVEKTSRLRHMVHKHQKPRRQRHVDQIRHLVGMPSSSSRH